MLKQTKGKDREDPEFKMYLKPFSSSPFYVFFDYFMLGLKMETYVKGTQQCQESAIFTLDDISYFYNNITDYDKSSWEAPIMNFTKLTAGNFSSSILNCYNMYYSFNEFMMERWIIFREDLSNYILGYIFNLMGASLKMLNILKLIKEDIKQQYYADVFR